MSAAGLKKKPRGNTYSTIRNARCHCTPELQQSMGVRRQHTVAAAYLAAFVEEIRSSGLLRALIERHNVRGLSIAAPTPRQQTR